MHNGVLIYVLLSMLCKSTYLALIFLKNIFTTMAICFFWLKDDS